MRYYAIEPDLLARNFGRYTNSFWRAFSRQLKEMLCDKGKPPSMKDDEKGITEEVVFIGPELLAGTGLPAQVPDVRHYASDWDWYVLQRTCPNGRHHDVTLSPEDELLQELANDPIDGLKQVILVYGQTGHGKTTFLRHFFYNWLPKQTTSTSFKRHIVIRVSMGLGSLGERIENDYDHKIQRALFAAFPWVLTPDCLFRIVQHQHRNTPAVLQELITTFPYNSTPFAIIKWIRKFNDINNSYVEGEEYHDFNRMLVDFLTENYNISFVFIMDNIDQTPPKLHDRFYMLARHKLDWIRNIDKVVFILAVRSYLLDKVQKESVVQAFNPPPTVRIFPPLLNLYLTARISSFEKNMLQERHSIPMDDGKTIDVTTSTLGNMLNRFNQNYSQPNNDIVMANLSSYDIRRQSQYVLACLQSRSIEWCDYVHYFTEGQKDVHFSQFDILRAILKADNSIVAPPPDQMLANIFSCGTGDHYANSLNKWYILRILSGSDRFVNAVVATLDKLGHPECLTRKSLEVLLLSNIIASNDGVHMKEDNIETLTVSSECTLLGREFLTNIPFNLIYLECMAFLTPLEETIVSDFPEVRSRDGASFEQYMHATALLLRQIRHDERTQMQKIQGDSDALSLFNEHQLGGFSDKMLAGILKTLHYFKDHQVIVVDDWSRILARFEE